jgi:hypothetical protein
MVRLGKSSPYRSEKLLSRFRYHTLYSSTPLRGCRSSLFQDEAFPTRQSSQHADTVESPYNILVDHSSTCPDAPFSFSEILHPTNETPFYAPLTGLRHHPHVTRNHCSILIRTGRAQHKVKGLSSFIAPPPTRYSGSASYNIAIHLSDNLVTSTSSFNRRIAVSFRPLLHPTPGQHLSRRRWPLHPSSRLQYSTCPTSSAQPPALLCPSPTLPTLHHKIESTHHR